MFEATMNRIERSARIRIASSSACALVQILRPVRAAQHSHHGGRHGGTLTSGDAIKMNGAVCIKSGDRCALQGRWDRRGVRDNGYANIGFEQLDQVTLR